jgi:hypothetical protein
VSGGAIVAQATSAVGGEAGTVLAGVHERPVPLLPIRSLFLLSLIAFISWPLFHSEKTSFPEFDRPVGDIGPTVRVELAGRGHARVPRSWTTHSAVGLHSALRLLAWSSQDDVVGSNIYAADVSELSRSAAFVSVSTTCCGDALPDSPPPPLPSRLLPSNSRGSLIRPLILGEPVLSWAGLLGGETSVSYWVGPDASPRTRAEAKYVLDSLRMPGWDRKG